MTRFSVGDHARWNSEAGHVEGVIAKKHTRDVDWKGYTEQDPQHETKSDKSDHIASHKGGALTKIPKSG